MAEEEAEGNEYRWESGYEKTWEAIQEDDDGLVGISVEEIVQKQKRKRLQERQTRHKLGMMRHLYVVLDMSESMLDQDLKPNRVLCTLKLLEKFIEEFFDHNPISQIGFIITRNKRAEKVCDMVGHGRPFLEVIEKLREYKCCGELSIQNCLKMTLNSLQYMPSHTSREVLFILGSLSTCDLGDIKATISMVKKANVKCSVIGLAAETHICRYLCKETGGQHSVVVDEYHLQSLLTEHLNPMITPSSNECSLIKMGFPQYLTSSDQADLLSLCMCHVDPDCTTELGKAGYFCPQCNSKYCELPVECKACGLTLVSATHLARSYHHLFPVPLYKEVVLPAGESCFGCMKVLKAKVSQCHLCLNMFCLECDLFVHEVLNVCPGCSSTSQIEKKK